MTDKSESQGHVVTLPNGQKRIDFIRDNYYDKKTHKHEEGCMSRSAIKNAINEMLPEGEQIPYQIVFAATKTDDDPRVAAKERAEERAAAKKAKEDAEVKDAPKGKEAPKKVVGKKQ